MNEILKQTAKSERQEDKCSQCNRELLEEEEDTCFFCKSKERKQPFLDTHNLCTKCKKEVIVWGDLKDGLCIECDEERREMKKFELQVTRVVSKRFKSIVTIEARNQEEAEDELFERDSKGEISWEEEYDERSPSDNVEIDDIREIEK